MANSKIFYNNIVPAKASITMSSEATGYGKKNLIDNIVVNKARTTGITNETIIFDLGSSLAIKGVGIFGSNIVATDTLYQFYGDNANPPVTNLGNIDKAENSLFETTTTARYFMIKATKAAGTYIEWGNIYIFTDAYEFNVNFLWGYNAGRSKKVNRNISPDLSIYNKKVATSNKYDLNFYGLDSTQRDLMDGDIRDNDYIIFKDQRDAATSYFYFGVADIGKPKHENGDTWSMGMNFIEGK